MICTCDIDAFEVAENAKLAALVALGLRQKGDLATAILLSLGLEHNVKIDVASDMWFNVCGTLPDGTVHSVDCDDPLDGLVFVWSVLNNASSVNGDVGDRRIGRNTGCHTITLALESATKLAELRALASARNLHRESCITCVAGKKCPKGRTLFERLVELQISIAASWGSPDARVAPAFYGLTKEDVTDEA